MKIQSLCEIAGKSACLFFCYGFIAKLDLYAALSCSNDLMKLGIIGSDFSVNNAKKLFEYFGVNAEIIKSDKAPEDDDSLYCAKYSNNGFAHWVVCTNGKIVFNSLDSSVCVKNGTITDYRVVKIIR